MEIINQQAGNKGKFVILDEGQEAGFLSYEIMDNSNIKAVGTLVHEAFRSKKYGVNLFDALVEYAKTNNIKVYPVCPYIVKMFQRNPELSYLLDPSYQAL